jgi:hypothetical protein
VHRSGWRCSPTRSTSRHASCSSPTKTAAVPAPRVACASRRRSRTPSIEARPRC